ncbi:hypothetical protein M378DRAFT_166440 [Amanita muscaria Koide BX008]|uniref:Uncharacterized protein n=1 Tax=Amanita muscaria (strain Koide BX008) TaxID=946122 RepID=A0A0C2T5F3_AMAMK|nr:hypothetical protein M378DRAFT_166440 [Amanita muscaria Koide BX008]
MGNDGGSIPDRRDLVRTKPKAEQADKANQTRARSFFCALSKKKLQEPIVSCALGMLYNKEALIEFLLDRTAYGDGEDICGHIRSLKDVKTLKLTSNPTPAPPESAGNAVLNHAQFICPLSLKEMNGSQPFVYIATCGCVFTQSALKTVTKASSEEKEKGSESPPPEGEKFPLELCPQCGGKFSRKDDVRMINPGPEDQERMREEMERRRLLEPAKPKKSKKRKAEEAEQQQQQPAKKQTLPSLNPSVSAASRAVVSEIALEEAKRKATESEAVKSLYVDGKSKVKETFMTWGTFTRYA